MFLPKTSLILILILNNYNTLKVIPLKLQKAEIKFGLRFMWFYRSRDLRRDFTVRWVRSNLRKFCCKNIFISISTVFTSMLNRKL